MIKNTKIAVKFLFKWSLVSHRFLTFSAERLKPELYVGAQVLPAISAF